MSPVLAEAKRYLWRHGFATDTVTDPVDLIRDLTGELEKHEAVPIEVKARKRPSVRR